MDLEEKRRRELLGGSSVPGPAGGAGAGAGAGGDATEGDDAGRAALLNGGKAKPAAAAAAAAAAADGADATDGEGDLPEVDFTFANFDNLDITTSDIDFDQIDDDLANFQQDEIVRDALTKGVDLRNYSRQIQIELRRAQVESVADYVAEADDIAKLHTDVTTCETVLMNMESMLQHFQDTLGGISREIRHLQDKSMEMNVQLKNRKAVQSKLQLFLDKVAVSRPFIESICEDEINDAYVALLRQLSAKISYTAQRSTQAGRAGAGGGSNPAADFGIDPSDTKAGHDVIPELERLRVKAVTRVRAFLLEKIADLRKPRTNVQMVQEHVLLRHKFLLRFLHAHAPAICNEVRTFYIDTMSGILQALFKSYNAALNKMKLNIATKNDLIVVETNAVRGLFSSRVDLSKRADAFAIGSRADILNEPDAAPIMVHVAQANKQKFPYEAIFRSVQRHLMDSATSEYAFVREFFAEAGATREEARHIFQKLFVPALSLVMETLENYLFHCFDAVGLLLMIHMTYAHRRVMQQRRVPVLDTYFDRVNMLLWPRIKAVLDMNLNSVRNANRKRLGSIELQPHYVTRRYAEFAASVLMLHHRLQDMALSDDMLLHNMTVLRSEFVSLLRRMAAEHGTRKARCVFLINNYDQVLRVQTERKVEDESQKFFSKLREQQIQKYVDEELAETFGRLLLFVRQTHAAMGIEETAPPAPPDAAGAGAGAGAGSGSGAGGAAAAPVAPPKPPPLVGKPQVDPAVVEALVMDFEANWKAGVEKINKSVMKYFSNFKNGMGILQQVLTQLLLCYTRFQDIIKAAWPDGPPPFSRHIVSLTTAFFEIKKYSRNKF